MAPPLLLYLALGQHHPVAWQRFAYDVAACLFFGVALSQLRSFPALRQPHWPPVVIVASAFITYVPSGFQMALYLLGLFVASVGPAWWIGRRFAIPWWASALAVPPAVLFLHTTHLYGAEPPEVAELVESVVADVTWPLRPEQLPDPVDVGPPLIVISVDTLRADSARTMQTWQRLAERGAHWDSAMSTSSWTMPALASLQTGLMPGDHGAGCLLDSHCQGMFDGIPTVATRLSEAGYATAAVSVNPWAGEGNGFGRGFDMFRDLGNQAPRRFLFARHAFDGGHPQDGGVAVDIAIDLLDRLDTGSSFYLWLHVIDPHLPYVNSDDSRLVALDVGNLRNAGVLSDEFRELVRDGYAHEVELLDAHLMRFLDALQERGVLDRALVVFTSDHGEEFWENGGVEHGHSHLREVIEVPMVVAGPGVEAGPRAGTASLLDVPHTLLHAAGVETDGVDLRSRVGPGRIATAQGNLHHWVSCSARNAATKMVIDGCESEDDRTLSGFDRVADPTEDDPLDLGERHAVQNPEKHGEADQSTQALRALGYVD